MENIQTKVLDTNVLLAEDSLEKIFHSFYSPKGKRIIVLPLISLSELDNLKKKDTESGYLARTATNELYYILKSKGGNFFDGINLKDDGSLVLRCVSHNLDTKLMNEIIKYLNSKNDCDILATALDLVDKKDYGKIELVSDDKLLLFIGEVIAKELRKDIELGEYRAAQIVTNFNEINKGYLELNISDKNVDEVCKLIHNNPKEIGLESIIDDIKTNFNIDGDIEGVLKRIKVYPNHYFIFSYNNQPIAFGRYTRGKIVPLIFLKENWGAFNLKKNKGHLIIDHIGIIGKDKKIPYSTSKKIDIKNIQQAFAFDAVLDPSIVIAAIHGPLGSGKTLITLAGGIAHIGKTYNKIYFTRSIRSQDKEEYMGYLPGRLEEKFDIYTNPLKDNLPNVGIFNKEEFFNDMFFEKLPINYLGGRSLPAPYLIIEESQLIPSYLLKMIIGRIADVKIGDSVIHGKAVVVGSFGSEQIGYATGVSWNKNALIMATNKLAEDENTSVVELKDVERGLAASIVEKKA